jgi:hypothetical protein
VAAILTGWTSGQTAVNLLFCNKGRLTECSLVAICNCPEKAVQTARHLLTECNLFSSERPAVLQTLSLPLVLKYHINTVSITSFLRSIFHTLQEQD